MLHGMICILIYEIATLLTLTRNDSEKGCDEASSFLIQISLPPHKINRQPSSPDFP